MKETQEKAMEELFDFAHPEQCRELLWEWLRVTVTGGFKWLSTDILSRMNPMRF